MTTRFAFTLACTLLSASLARAATPPTYVGVWQGRGNGQAVVVCLAEYEAAFYFMRDRVIHPLRQEDQGGMAWVEAPGEQRIWSLLQAKPGHLQGQRRGEEGSSAQPLSLSRVAAAASAGHCGQAFFEPLLKDERLVTRPATFEGHAYETLSSRHGQTLLWPSDQPGAERFNTFSRRWLRDATVEDFRMAACGGERVGKSRLHPKAWSQAWLVLAEDPTELYCFASSFTPTGGGYRTIDLGTGAEVNTWTWLQQGARTGEPRAPESSSPNALRRLIERRGHWNGDACDPPDGSWLGQPYPTRAGLVFNARQGRHADLCVQNILVRWPALAPHLTQAGRDAMQRTLSPASDTAGPSPAKD